MKKCLLFIYDRFPARLSRGKDFVLLAIRWALAYGFWGPAMMKWQDMGAIVNWFDSLGIPAPALNAYLAASTELLGSILLFVGLFTRIIGIPLIVTMIVAIVTVHLGHGFEAGNNGFEIPLYYILMLLALMVFGSGKHSLDHLIKKSLK